MFITPLVIISVACMAWSLWIRRLTWSCRWEVAATLNIALQATAVLLIYPGTSDTLGRWLHSVTGMWNLEDYLGHDCYVVAASAVVYNAIGRLGNDGVFQRRFTQYVERPATICIPVLMALFTMGSAVREYAHDFFALEGDWWLDAYWVVLCGMLIYLLTYACWALWIIRKDERSRRTADIYLVSSVSGIIACIWKITTAFDLDLMNITHGVLVWIFSSLCGAGFAVSSALSWMQKKRWLKIQMWHLLSPDGLARAVLTLDLLDE